MGALCATFRRGACCVYRWTFATEAHLAGACCNGAATACANATPNLVCQQRLEPWRTITSGRGACARGLTTRGGAICGAAPKGGRCRRCSNVSSARDDRLIRPDDVFGEQVSDSAAVADAAIARGNDDLHHIGEEAGWRQVSRCLRLLEHRHADPRTRCGDRQRTYPGEPFAVGDQQQSHCGLVDEDRLADWSDEFDHVADAQTSECILAAISSRLQRNLNAAAEQVDARDRGDTPHAIATRLWTHKVERVAGAKTRNQCWRAELKRNTTWG
jgi:hypothetical protein